MSEIVQENTELPVAEVSENPAGAAPGSEFDELGSVDFLDDIDFSLDDVESRIAPLALAHT